MWNIQELLVLLTFVSYLTDRHGKNKLVCYSTELNRMQATITTSNLQIVRYED